MGCSGYRSTNVWNSLNRLLGLGLVTLRAQHLVEVHHPELHLRVVGARVGRIERQELAKLVLRVHIGGAVVLAEIRVAYAKLGFRAQRALRVRLEQFGEIRARAWSTCAL